MSAGFPEVPDEFDSRPVIHGPRPIRRASIFENFSGQDISGHDDDIPEELRGMSESDFLGYQPGDQ